MSIAAAALDQLVHQFSDPLSFYRELVQNAIDAGSAEVDIYLEHNGGVMVIHVDDYGEGMNREIIDTRLTRLFSSRKDGDLTKIGKFGIGFVSVFAIAPEAVVVDTARDGESWRVLFAADRSFERLVRSEPVDGTRIRLIKSVSDEEYQHFLRRSREVVCFWCRHVETEIRFQGEVINQELCLDSPCQVCHREEGTEILAGYPADGTPRIGYYNRGLTLLEGRAAPGQRASIVVSSRHLEHTLARDDVRQDAGFRKVMRTVDRLVEQELPRQLAALLAQQLAAPRPGAVYRPLLAMLARCLQPALSWVFPAVELHHGGGHQEGVEWVGDPACDRLEQAAHLVYGPYTRELPAGRYRATWHLRCEWQQLAPGAAVATLDVFDAEHQQTLASRTIRRRHLGRSGEPLTVGLDFRCHGDERLELRTLWHRTTLLSLREVRVHGGERVVPGRSPFAGLGLFETPDRRRVSLAEAARAAARGRLVRVVPGSSVGPALADQGRLVICLAADAAEQQVLAALGPQPPIDGDRRYCLPCPAEPAVAQRYQALLVALTSLGRVRWRLAGQVLAARFVSPGSAIAGWPAVSQASPFTLTEVAEAQALPHRRLAARPRYLLINTGHATVARLAELAGREPELAAYLLLSMLIAGGSDAAAEHAELATAAWQKRCQRSSSHGC